MEVPEMVVGCEVGMPWIYFQTSGNLYQDKQFVYKGYSGAREGKNKPEMQDLLPAGR